MCRRGYGLTLRLVDARAARRAPAPPLQQAENRDAVGLLYEHLAAGNGGRHELDGLSELIAPGLVAVVEDPAQVGGVERVQHRRVRVCVRPHDSVAAAIRGDRGRASR